jgi:hypothetical protein
VSGEAPPRPKPPPSVVVTPQLGPVSRAKVEEALEYFVDLSPSEREVFMDRALQIMSREGITYY